MSCTHSPCMDERLLDRCTIPLCILSTSATELEITLLEINLKLPCICPFNMVTRNSHGTTSA